MPLSPRTTPRNSHAYFCIRFLDGLSGVYQHPRSRGMKGAIRAQPRRAGTQHRAAAFVDRMLVWAPVVRARDGHGERGGRSVA